MVSLHSVERVQRSEHVKHRKKSSRFDFSDHSGSAGGGGLMHGLMQRISSRAFRHPVSVSTSTSAARSKSAASPTVPNDCSQDEVDSESHGTSFILQKAASLFFFQPHHVLVTFSDRGGISRVLELRMPKHKVTLWVDGLQRVLAEVPRIASPAHWRWALACATTSTSKQRDLPIVLMYANASSQLLYPGSQALEDALRSVEECEEMQALPKWLRAGATAEGQMRLDVWQVTWLLLWMSTVSPEVKRLFSQHATSGTGRMSRSEFLAFIGEEQRASVRDTLLLVGEPAGLLDTGDGQRAFDCAIGAERSRPASEGQVENGLSLMQFALHLLSPLNRAIATSGEEQPLEELQKPLTHYWTACSHNSCALPARTVAVRFAPVESNDRSVRIPLCDRPRGRPAHRPEHRRRL